MAINYIEAITIDGLGNSPSRKLFNGYIYRLNYDISMGTEKSKITANIVSEDGTYSISPSDLTYNRIYPIQIGSSISVNMFLIRYRFIGQPESKILELEFGDTSRILDVYWVGLYNKDGTQNTGNLIIVGSEVHPCDRGYTGNIDSIPQLEDHCHPCRNTALTTAVIEEVNCQEMSRYMIFDVMYNWGDLIEALAPYVHMQAFPDPNPYYKTKYTGTIRDVIQAWCSDYGWTYYWENETVKFLDLRNTINVNAQITDFCPNVSAYEQEWSIENTVQGGLITLYERPGKNEKYQCEDARYFQIPIFEAGVGIAEIQVTTDIAYEAAGLSQYSDVLRDLWYYYDKYHMKTANDYVVNTFLPKWGLTILSAAFTLGGNTPDANGLEPAGLNQGSTDQTYPNPGLGVDAPQGFPLSPQASSNLEFLSATPPTQGLQNVQAAILANPQYKMCFQLLNVEEQWVVANGLVKDANDYFFFVAYYDRGAHQACIQEEKEFGKEFIGRYHVYQPDLTNPKDTNFFEDYTFYQEQICNQVININDKKIQFDCLADGKNDSFKFYNNPGINENGDFDTVSSLPFAKWLTIFRDSQTTQNNPTSLNRPRTFKLCVITKSGNAFTPSPDVQYTLDTDEEDNPNIKDAIKNPALIQQANTYSPIILEQKNNDQGEFIPRKVLGDAYDNTLDRSNVFICIGRSVGKNDFILTTTTGVNQVELLGYPFDGKPVRTEYGNEFDVYGDVVYKYPNLRCQVVGNETLYCNGRNFNTPIGTFSFFEPTYSLYGVVIEKQKQIDHIIQKLETQNQSNITVGPTIAKLKVVQKDISDSEINVFNNTNNSCVYNMQAIMEYHELYANNLDYTQASPLQSMKFTIEGIDLANAPLIGDGLISVSINLDGDQGIRTTYELGTRLMQPVNEKVLRGIEQITNFGVIYNTSPVAPTIPSTGLSSNQPPGSTITFGS